MRKLGAMLRFTQKLQTFARLSWSQRLLACEAIMQLGIARVQVAVSGQGVWCDRLLNTSDRSTVGGYDAVIVRHIAQAIQRASRNLPRESLCLAQALAARAMLNRRNIANNLGIGVSTDAADKRAFHAWLMVDGRFVTGAFDAGKYRALTSFHTQQSPVTAHNS